MILSDAAFTVMLNVLVPEALPLIALTVKLNVPVVVGVPEITPAVPRVSPPGKFPELTDHEALLTDEASRAEYAVPTVAYGREVVVIVIVVLSA